MEETQVCPECDMEFDWTGVEEDGMVYCCEACSLGEPCTCPQHEHPERDVAPLTGEMLSTPGPV